jgi:tRNA (Thr-GGU) A37 N-methylase
MRKNGVYCRNQLLEVGENYIKIDNCDMVSNTPVLDIKAKRA